MQPELDRGIHSSQTSSSLSDDSFFALRTRIFPVEDDRDFMNGGIELNSPLELLPSTDGAEKIDIRH